jgi:hypothetical protein
MRNICNVIVWVPLAVRSRTDAFWEVTPYSLIDGTNVSEEAAASVFRLATAGSSESL